MEFNFTKTVMAAAAMTLTVVTTQAQTVVEPARAAEQTTIYTANFINEDGGFTPDVPSVWKKNASRGWQAFGRIDNKNMSIDALLTSPEFDLTDYTDATLSFTHIASLAKNDTPSDVLHVEILDGDKVNDINDYINWPDGTNYDPVKSGNVSLKQWAGKKIKVQFHYSSTTVEALIWAISDMTITGTPSSTGINDVTATAAFDPAKPYEVYSLDGQRVNAAYNGVKIIKQNGKTLKVIK